jgi:hypothetical protein
MDDPLVAGPWLLFGVLLVLSATVFYRPLERMTDMIDGHFYRLLGFRSLQYSFRQWIRATPLREMIHRGIGLAIGLLVIAIWLCLFIWP